MTQPNAHTVGMKYLVIQPVLSNVINEMNGYTKYVNQTKVTSDSVATLYTNSAYY